ncbi:MAG: FIST C-terminal domain-containing protein [Treponema sp.]|nr:FIST C-terminal domain-containing protein [Treponema sp.]
MIEAQNAFTFEIDDEEIAVKEMLDQLDFEKLKSHSLGILAAYPEFLNTGIIQNLCKALPFDVIGCTTIGSAAAGELGEIMLSLIVLTSDEVIFSAGLTPSLSEEQDGPMEEAYKKACEGANGKPAMALVFVPYIVSLGGEAIVESFNRISGGIPLFGTLAIDASNKPRKNETIFNGEGSKDRLAFVLFFGDLHPSFFTASIPEEKIQKKRGVITKSHKNIIMEVNNMPVVSYLKDLGLQRESGAWETSSFPFIIDYNDGTKPVTRSIYVITEEGYAACGGHVPENTTISIGDIGYADIVRTAVDALEETLKKNTGSVLLLFACLTRYLALGANTTAEMEKVRECIGQQKKYQFCYSGGEICPVQTEKGELINRFHNCTFTACLI